MPGCGPISWGIRGTLADRRPEAKKIFSCVTTRRRNFGVLNGLGRKFGSLTAILLCLGVLGSDIGILATFSLAPRRLPATNQPQALRVLAVVLQAGAAAGTCDCNPYAGNFGARSAPSGQTAMSSRNLANAHGRSCSQGKARGECA